MYKCMIVYVYGCMGVWVYGCMGTWAKTKVKDFFHDLSNTIDTFSLSSKKTDSNEERILAAETILEA